MITLHSFLISDLKVLYMQNWATSGCLRNQSERANLNWLVLITLGSVTCNYQNRSRYEKRGTDPRGNPLQLCQALPILLSTLIWGL
jgi:hypothetical protein